MKKILALFLFGMLTILGSTNLWAATETTVYYVISDDELSTAGANTVTLNVNYVGNGDDWEMFTMTKTGATYDSKAIYSYTFTDKWNGLGALQFQLRNGDTWIKQDQPISSWTSATVYNGKMVLYGTTNWIDFSSDQYLVSWTANEGGTVSMLVLDPTTSTPTTYTTSPVAFSKTSNCGFTFNILPNAGYEIESFTVDGVDKTSSLTKGTSTYSYACTGVKANMTLAVTFKSTTPVVATYYLKHPWGGGSWTWQQLTKDEGSDPETYSVTANYGGNGCNWNTKADDTGSSWIGSPTLVDSPVSGDLCKFTFTPSTSTLTITKQEAAKYTLTVASDGNGTVWIDGESELSKEVTEGGIVKVGALASNGYYFKNWTIDGTEVSKCHIYSRTVNATETLTANFTTEAPAKERVYFTNTSDWTTVNFYGWGGEAGVEYGWPGTAMTKCGVSADGKHDVYYFDAEPGEFANCIFNDGDKNQTADLTWTNGKCYNNGSWEIPTSANLYVGAELKCATFCAPFDVAIPTGVKAYTADEVVDNSWIKMTEVETTIPAGTPVVLVAEDLEGTYEQNFYGVATATTAEKGVLVGNLDAVKAVPTSSQTSAYYVLQNGTEGTGWYKVTTKDIKVGTNRCYMGTSTAARAFYGMNFGEETAINSISATAAKMSDGKYLVNGRIVAVKAGKAYNMNGQVVK